MNQLCYRLFHRKGHGVHSPFVYDLITKVIEERSEYYAFGYIERHFRSRNNYGRLIFRLICYFKCRDIYIIGNTPKQLCLYAAMTSTQNMCYVYDDNRNEGVLPDKFIRMNNLHNIYLVDNNLIERNACEGGNEPWKMIVINNTNALNNLHYSENKTILVVHNIRKDKEQKNYWRKMIAHDKTNLSLNLFNIGIVFIDEKLPWKQYKTYYNYD